MKAYVNDPETSLGALVEEARLGGSDYVVALNRRLIELLARKCAGRHLDDPDDREAVARELTVELAQ